MFELFLTQFAYYACFALFGVGVYILISAENLIKKLFGLSIFQTSILLFIISLGYVSGGKAPILDPADLSAPHIYVNPLPQVLVLTAIVVGLAVLAVGLALAIKLETSNPKPETDE